uniref:Transposase n=1 Tax=Steinernema glaseri TaxID=37863 RepID=A0A1I7YPF0_9BILA
MSTSTLRIRDRREAEIEHVTLRKKVNESPHLTFRSLNERQLPRSGPFVARLPDPVVSCVIRGNWRYCVPITDRSNLDERARGLIGALHSEGGANMTYRSD